MTERKTKQTKMRERNESDKMKILQNYLINKLIYPDAAVFLL